MERTPVNPWDWGLQWSMNQGEVVEGLTRTLHCSGQVALVPDSDSEMGVSVVHAGDIRGLVLPELLVEIEATAGD